MAKKVPPPPPIASNDPQFNRWLVELTSILSNQGGIDPGQVTGLPAVITQVGTNTTAITALQGTTGGQGSSITALQNHVATIDSEITTINGQLTTLGARAQVLNGSGAPNAGLGNVNDWFADTAGKHIYVKTAAATWTLII